MKRIIFILLLIAVAFTVYWFKFRGDDGPQEPKQQALKVSLHSAAFNSSIDSLLHYYFAVKDAFVDEDSLKAKEAGIALVAFVNRINLDELKKDTTGIFETASTFLNDVKSNAESMRQSQLIVDMRRDFKNISENLYPFLKSIHYEGKKLYWQNCITAFGEGNSANWISAEGESSNPYQNKNNPACAEIQDTIKAQ